MLAVSVIMGLGGCATTPGGANGDSIVTKEALYEDSTTIITCEVAQRLCVEYPVAEDRSVVADSIRAWLHEELQGTCYPQMEEGLTPDQLYGGDVSDFEAMTRYYGELGMKQMLAAIAPDSTSEDEWVPMGYNNGLDASMQVQTPTYVTYLTAYDIYTGGAHGLYIIGQETFRKSDGHRMGWDLIDTKKARPQLDALIEAGLNEYFATDTEDNTEGYTLRDMLLLMDDPDTPDVDESTTIPLPNTPPALTDKGISIIYQQYEIAPYAAGLPSFYIPYDKAADILTPAAKELIGM